MPGTRFADCLAILTAPTGELAAASFVFHSQLWGFLPPARVDPVEPTAASAGSAKPAPVSTASHTMATDIAGPVDLGSESATVPMTEIAGPIQDASRALRRANARLHSLASNHRQPSVIASASHRKSPRRVAARQAPSARKQAKVS